MPNEFTEWCGGRNLIQSNRTLRVVAISLGHGRIEHRRWGLVRVCNPETYGATRGRLQPRSRYATRCDFASWREAVLRVNRCQSTKYWYTNTRCAPTRSRRRCLRCRFGRQYCEAPSRSHLHDWQLTKLESTRVRPLRAQRAPHGASVRRITEGWA